MAAMTMSRRQLLAVASAGALLAPWRAAAQTTGKIPRIAYVTSAGRSRNIDAFERGLRDGGLVVGETVSVDYRFGDGHADRVPALLDDAMRLGPDVLFAASPYVIRVARQAKISIPVVGIDLESDPVEMGWVASLARPGGNVTGVFLDMPELGGKQLQFLGEVLPKVQRVAVLWDAQIAQAQFKATEGAGQAARVTIQSLAFRRPDEFKSLFEAARAQRAEALIVLSSPVVFQYLKPIGDLARQHRLPSISIFPRFAEAGGLMGYGPNLEALFVQTAKYVERILKGARAGDLPIQRPAVFELTVNLRTAKALGLTMPPSLTSRADQVIE
jgi:ABC-type uncharacterized transport system substrate-binding protein